VLIESKIKGVKIRQLTKIPDERGCILHMLRCDDKDFERFGEIYFSTVYPGVVKAWHLHKTITLNYAVIKGMIKLVVYDGRKGSPTEGNLQELFIGDSNYQLVTIPPGVWNGFKCIGSEYSIVANCATSPHDPNEITRLDPDADTIPYDWGIKHR
jgi:dTDP-4-dehydrorhamnose 3,5-epimerase